MENTKSKYCTSAELARFVGLAAIGHIRFYLYGFASKVRRRSNTILNKYLNREIQYNTVSGLSLVNKEYTKKVFRTKTKLKHVSSLKFFSIISSELGISSRTILRLLTIICRLECKP